MPKATKPSTRPRILVLDSHPIIRDGLVSMLEPALDSTVVAESGGFQDGLRRISDTRFDLVISDFQIREETVLPFLEKLGKLTSGPRCLIYSAFDELAIGYPCVRAGAFGFVSKAASVDRLVEAADTVLQGRPFVSETITEAMMKHGGEAASPSGVNMLSAWEIEVFTLLGGAWSVSQIATRLGISAKSVETHRDRIMHKLRCADATEVTAVAMRWLDSSSVTI